MNKRVMLTVLVLGFASLSAQEGDVDSTSAQVEQETQGSDANAGEPADVANSDAVSEVCSE